jgi:hypothetical protein
MVESSDPVLDREGLFTEEHHASNLRRPTFTFAVLLAPTLGIMVNTNAPTARPALHCPAPNGPSGGGREALSITSSRDAARF